MLFWIVLFAFVTFLGLAIWTTCRDYYSDASFVYSVFATIFGIILLVMSIIIVCSNVGVDAQIAEYHTRYEMLTYQYENDIYDNDNDLGKRELISDIQNWNEDLAYRKEIQDDFWVGIFYPNIYDQFKPIDLGSTS